MGELQEEYGDLVEFNIIPPAETAQAGADMERFGFVDQRHGLVVFDVDGEPAAKLPGHAFGQEEIRSAIESALE